MTIAIFDGFPEDGILPNEKRLAHACPNEFRAEHHPARQAVMRFRVSGRKIDEIEFPTANEGERTRKRLWLGALLERRKLNGDEWALVAYLWQAAGARLP